MKTGVSDPSPEEQTPQPYDQELATAPLTQATGYTDHVSLQSLSSSSIIPADPPYPTTANHNTSTAPDHAPSQGYQPIGRDQLALVPRRNFPNVIPTIVQEEVPQPHASGWTPLQPEASTSTLPKPPPVKVRLPRDAPRSRLGKDILKQLGKPSGSVPPVPTKYEYKQRKKAAAQMESTPGGPSTEPVAEPQPVLDRDDGPSLPEVAPVPDQVPQSASPANPPPETPADQPPSLEYPSQVPESAPPDANIIEQDVEMDVQPSDEPLVPQPSVPPRQDPPQDPAPTLVVSEPTQDKGGRSADDNPPPSEPSPKRTAPPPDVEIIEISDDEDQPAAGAITATIEPMEVDEEYGTGGTISQNLSELPLDGEDTLVVTEMEPPSRRSSQEPVVSGGTQFVKKKSQKNQPYVLLPPLPDFSRRKEGKERAPIEEEDEEGLYEVSIWEARFLIYYSFHRPRTSSCPGLDIF
jgi:hypothetical protein